MRTAWHVRALLLAAGLTTLAACGPSSEERPFAGANRPHCQAPGTYQDIFTDQTEYYRAIYEKAKGIQTGALGPFQQFVADQWQRVVTAYEIDQALNRLNGADPLPFPEYLQ